MPDSGKLYFEQLSEDNKPSDFQCSDKDLDEFLLDDALMHQDEKIAMTTLVFYEDRVVAYFSLCTDCISLKAEEKEELCEYEIKYTEFPAIKIARLAVISDFQNRGIGKTILKYIVGYARSLQDDIGVRFLSVDAYPKSAEFYEHLGFLYNLHAKERGNKHTHSMRYDLEPLIYEGDGSTEGN